MYVGELYLLGKEYGLELNLAAVQNNPRDIMGIKFERSCFQAGIARKEEKYLFFLNAKFKDGGATLEKRALRLQEGGWRRDVFNGSECYRRDKSNLYLCDSFVGFSHVLGMSLDEGCVDEVVLGCERLEEAYSVVVPEAKLRFVPNAVKPSEIEHSTTFWNTRNVSNLIYVAIGGALVLAFLWFYSRGTHEYERERQRKVETEKTMPNEVEQESPILEDQKGMGGGDKINEAIRNSPFGRK